MDIIFSWVDAVMIILMFTVIGLISAKNQYDKKLKKEKQGAE